VLEMIFVIVDAFWHTCWVPGASNLSGFFVNFLGKAPGSVLGAFWMPFGCPLGALGTSLGHFGSTLAAFVVALQRLSHPVPPCPTISHHFLPK